MPTFTHLHLHQDGYVLIVPTHSSDVPLRTHVQAKWFSLESTMFTMFCIGDPDRNLGWHQGLDDACQGAVLYGLGCFIVRSLLPALARSPTSTVLLPPHAQAEAAVCPHQPSTNAPPTPPTPTQHLHLLP